MNPGLSDFISCSLWVSFKYKHGTSFGDLIIEKIDVLETKLNKNHSNTKNMLEYVCRKSGNGGAHFLEATIEREKNSDRRRGKQRDSWLPGDLRRE